MGVGAATGRLQHLVVGASALVDGAVAKPHGHISGELHDLKALELAVGAVPRDEGLGLDHERSSVTLLSRSKSGSLM